MKRRNLQFPFHYAEAVRLDPNLPKLTRGSVWNWGVRATTRAQLPKIAQPVRLKPNYLEARLNFGIALTKRKRMAEAREQFEEVLRRSPTNAVAKKYIMLLEGK